MLCISPLQIAWDLKALLLLLLLCIIELENVMWIIVGNSKFLYEEKRTFENVCRMEMAPALFNHPSGFSSY
jgi:hypothetical protein